MAHLVQNRVHRKSVSFPCRATNVLTAEGEELSPNLGTAWCIAFGELNPPKSRDARNPLQSTPAVPVVNGRLNLRPRRPVPSGKASESIV
jgi:hypothetical protein